MSLDLRRRARSRYTLGDVVIAPRPTMLPEAGLSQLPSVICIMNVPGHSDTEQLWTA